MRNIACVYLTGIFIREIMQNILVVGYMLQLCNIALFLRSDMSWIPSYNMWGDC